MQLIIEIYAIKNCIEQLRLLAKQYESYTEVFAPSIFSVPSGTPLSRKLTDIRNNYRGIQINLQIVAQYLEYYVNDLENLENRMSNLGAVSSFHSNISFGSISETSGLVDKPYEFPKTRIFDGASNVAFADSAITEEVKYASFEDINRIMCGDELLQTKETQALMQKYHLDSNRALYILHKARGLQLGETKANGKPFLAPEVLKGEDTQITPIEAAFFNNYMSLASTYQMDALNAIKENSKSSIKDIDNIEKKLRGYNFSSLEHYQNEVQSKYALAKDEAKLEVSNFRTKQEWAARIGLSLDQVSKMSDNQLIETIVKKDRLIGSDYKKVLAIGDKVGFSENDQKRLYKLQSDYNNSSMAILQLEENARVQPYLKVQETQDFQKFHYEVPKVKIEKHYDQHDSGFMYNSSVDEYTYYKNCQEQYSYVNDTEIMGMKNLEAVCDLQSIAELYPEYEKEYYYYLETKGKEGAEQYLNDMKSTFARLSGEYKASKRLEYLRELPEEERNKEVSALLNSAGIVTTNAVVTSAYGVGDGFTGWFENVSHIGDQKRYLSSHEWEKNYFRSAISSEKSRTEGNYIHYEDGVKRSSSNVIDFTKNYGTPVAFTYDIGQGVGNMLPTMVASSVFAPAGVASRVVGGVTMGAGIYGGTYHDYMVQGYDESTAHKAAALSAIAETATEELYGGFSFLNGGPVYNFKTGVINVLKEGGQEVFQDANDPIIRAIVTGEKIDLSKINVPDLLKKEAYTFVVGGATAGVMNLPGQVSSSHSIKVNQSNLNLLGNYYNNGNITMDQLHDLVSSTLGISELENSDIASILKFNKNGLSTISKTANGTINPDLVLALGEISAANNIVVQQRDLVKNTPALAPYVSNISQNENAVVPDGIKDAYTKYKSLEEKLNSYGEKIKNSAKQFQLKDDSVKGLNKKMQDLKSQHVGLEELLEKYDAGEKVHVSKNLSEAFNEYLTLKSKEGIINQQLNEIQSKVHVDLGHRVHSLASSVANSVASSVTQAYEASAVVGIVPPVIRDIMNVFGGINSDTGQFRLDKKKYPKVVRQYMNDIMQDLNVSAQTGHVFESLFEDDEYVYGIHQAGRNKGEAILKDGLRLTGHSGKNGVSVSESVNLTENVSFHKGGIEAMPWAFRSILSAESYNDAMGTGDAVIFAFPKSMFLDLDTGDYDVKPGVNYYTVDKDTQMKYLDPKYIVGYVTNDHGKVSNFNFNPSYLNPSFLEKNGFRTQVSQNNTTDGEIDNRYNQQMTLESLQGHVEFKTSYLQKFVFEVEQLCQENEEFRAYLKKKIRGNISPELQETIDKYKEIRKSYTGEQLDLIDLYYLEKRYFDEDFEGVDLSELSSDMYESYTRKLRELQTMFFKSADVSEQVSFVQNSSHFACESDIISKFDEFDSPVQEAITEKLLQEQTFIFENGLAFDSALDFLQSRPQLFSRITSQNLPLLYKNSSNKNAVFDEISARVKQGDLVFDKAFRVSNSYAGINYQLSIDLLEDIKELRPDLHAEIMSLYESKKTSLFHDITSNPSIHLSIVQEITLASLISQNLISESNVDVVLSVLEKNGTSGYVNFGIFQDEVIHDLGIDFVKSVARFPNVTATILDLKSQSNSAYQLFVKMVRDTEQNSTFAQEKLVKLALSYLTEHSTVNYDNVYVHDFEQFLLVSSLNPSLNLVYSNHFASDLRCVYENQLLGSTSLEEGRNAFFMAKYSMSLENVESLLHAYGANLSEVSKDLNSSDSLLIHTLMEEYNQLNLEKLKQMYFGKVDSKNGMQMLDLTDSIRIAYKQRYVDAFQLFRNSVEDANFYYKDGVKVIPVQGNFDLLFRSSNSSVSVNQKDSNSWVHAYEHPIAPSTVGLATCYVNQDNFGHMKTGDAGVLYGYVPSNASTIFSMGTQDINSQVISYGAEAKAGEQFVLPSDMAKHNTRGYSEFEISFDNAKPDYVVLMSDASEQVRNNTFEAAKEWGIPVLEFDVEQLVHQQVNNIKSNIEQFRSTGDSQYLLKAISLYESSANSLGFNFDEINEDFFEDRSQLKELLDEIPIHQLAVEYAQVLVKNKNNSDIDKFKNGLQNILNNYKNTNENSEVVAVIPHTSNVTGIESVIDVLNQNSDSGSPSGAGDSFDQRYDSSIIENNDENIENPDNHLDDEGPVLLKTQNENNSVQTYISDNVSSLLSHSPVDLIRDIVRETYKNLNLDFYNRVNFYNNQTDPTTVGELKQGILDAMPVGLSKLEQARFAYLALSQQLGFDENLNSNPSENSYFDVKRKYDFITDDTVLNKKTVCVSWARIYSDILTSLGIDNKYQAMNHAWVEFDADGIIIKADATSGDVMDLSRAKLGQETLDFFPISGYSPDAKNGKISFAIYQDPSSPGSFQEALKQIDKNIHYIQDEYRTINKNAIIDDVNTSLTDKLRIFSKEVLDGMDFVGAKSLFLNFISSLKKSGNYEISGTDMVKLQKDGTMDILNITSILDENGQYRYFALHENMGLTEITARDLDVLRSRGYFFDSASKLKGYHYNAVSGAVSSLMNNVMSKIATVVSPDIVNNAGALNSSIKSLIETAMEQKTTMEINRGSFDDSSKIRENSNQSNITAQNNSLLSRLEQLRKDNPGIEEEYVRIQKAIELEHAVHLTPEMVEYRSIMQQLGLSVSDQQVETLIIEDDIINNVSNTFSGIQLDSIIEKNSHFLSEDMTTMDAKKVVEQLQPVHELHQAIEDDNYKVSAEKREIIARLNEIYIQSAINSNTPLEYSDYVVYSKGLLASISPVLVELYEKARQAGALSGFKGYEEHNFVHVVRVAEESLDVANKINSIVKNDKVGSFGIINPEIVYLAGLFHDAGMSQGGIAPNYVTVESYNQVSDIKRELRFNERLVAFADHYEIQELDANNPFVKIADDDSNKIRKQHAFTSSLITMEHGDLLGENAEIISMLTLLHSKSTSGVKDLTSTAQLSDALVQLQIACREKGYVYDVSKLVQVDQDGNPLVQIAYVDKKGEIVDKDSPFAIRKEVYIFKPGIEKQLRTGAAALRDGDCHAHKTGANHEGKAINVVSAAKLDENIYFASDMSLDNLCKKEALESEVNIAGEILSNENKDELFSKQIIIGERNTEMAPTQTINIEGKPGLQYTIQVKSGNVPACTWLRSVKEKIGEYETYKKADIVQRFVVELPADVSTSVRNFYEKMARETVSDRSWLQIEVR